MAATGFLSGWSALGLTGGVVLAVVLCADVAVPLFHNQGKTLPPYATGNPGRARASGGAAS